MKCALASWLLAASVIVFGCSHGASPSDAALEANAGDASGAAGSAGGGGTTNQGGAGSGGGGAGQGGAGGASCGDRRCATGELCRVLLRCGPSGNCASAVPEYQCIAIPAACRGAVKPTCACDGATVGYCSQAELCQCDDSTAFTLSCRCGGA